MIKLHHSMVRTPSMSNKHMLTILMNNCNNNVRQLIMLLAFLHGQHDFSLIIIIIITSDIVTVFYSNPKS